jgi:hypothetical protein
LDRSLQYLSFVQLALSPWAKQGRKCDAQALINKSVKAPFFPIRISGEYRHKNIMRVFVTNKLVLNENSQICSLAAIAFHDEFDGLNANWRISQRQFTCSSRKSIFGCFRPATLASKRS